MALDKDRGIITGCDAKQEWLLPWWWGRYSKFNAYPIAFFNFGMSPNGVAWCKEKGVVLSLPFSSYRLKPLSFKLKNRLRGANFSQANDLRAVWFTKTVAFLHSPFLLSCWLDLDCEVRGNIDPLFHSLDCKDEIALVKEPDSVEERSRIAGLLYPDEKSYNTGVVVFRQGANILAEAAELALRNNGQFLSDQDSLSRAIYFYRPPLVEMPSLYNWNMNQGMNSDALILHYVSTWKTVILLSLEVQTYTSLRSPSAP